MPETQDYEHLLDLDHVVGVAWDDEAEQVIAYVTKKVPEEELDDVDIVQFAVEKEEETDVVEVGLDRDADGFAPLTTTPEDHPEATDPGDYRRRRHRPIPGGVSEMHVDGTAATAGPYPAIVTDPSKGKWPGDVVRGTVVRLSNCHVYARSGRATIGDEIIQPSPYDGGVQGDDTSGTLLGYLPLADGVRADVAARTATLAQEHPHLESDGHSPYNGLSGDWPEGVYRASVGALRGRAVRKTGRTTDVTTGTINMVEASVRVDYGQQGVVTLRGQYMTSDMSTGGDSGSPVFIDDGQERGQLCALLFAGSDNASVVSPIQYVEADFGVRIMTNQITTLETTAEIPMEQPTVTLAELNTSDDPKANETVTATLTIESTYAEPVYLSVQGDELAEPVQLTAENETGAGTYRTSVDVPVTAPAEYQETFGVEVVAWHLVDDAA